MKKVLITGANGFVGTFLCAYFDRIGIPYRRAVRKEEKGVGSDTVAVGDIDSQTDWSNALSDIDVIIHLAARVHVLREDADNPLDEFRRVNSEGTLNLARQAAASGVQRFIYISTIKVNGEETFDRPFRADDDPAPADPYSISKFEAEKGLVAISLETGMEYVIIRPPLVYGRGAGGNFNRLVNLVKKGWYLPLKSIRNKRSLVSIENLCSLLSVSISHVDAGNKILLVSDGHDVSTPELIKLLGIVSMRPARLFPLSSWLLNFIGTMCGKGMELRRLTGNLQVDISETCSLLHWQPPVSLEKGLKDSI